MPKKPRATFTKEQRDLFVQKNLYPKRTELTNNADFRGVTGDVQAGNSGLGIRMEQRPWYKAAQRGQSVENLDRSVPATMAPHHRMGIQDQTAFLSGLTSADAETRRKTLAEGGLFIGNVVENITSLYDGKFSAAGRAAGMQSQDHGNVHRLAEDLRKQWGIETNSDDRSKDTFNGRPITDLPNTAKEGLQIQLGLQDELIIDKVERSRYQAFKKKYGHLPAAEQRKILLEQPQKVGNIPTELDPKPKPKPKAKPSTRKAVKAIGNRIPAGSGNMDEDLMTMSERLRIVPIEPYSMPRHLL